MMHKCYRNVSLPEGVKPLGDYAFGSKTMGQRHGIEKILGGKPDTSFTVFGSETYPDPWVWMKLTGTSGEDEFVPVYIEEIEKYRLLVPNRSNKLSLDGWMELKKSVKGSP